MRGGRQKSAGYRVPTERRGVLTIGPLVALRTDLLGLARSVDVVAGVDEILVAPRAFELPMPELGDGILGRHLLVQSDAPRAGRVPQPARVRPGRRAAHDPLAGFGPLGRSEGAPVLRRRAAPLHRRARPAGPRRPASRRGVRAGGRRRGEPRPQRRPARPADALRHHRRRRPARTDRLRAHDAPPRQGDARPPAAATDRTRSGRGSRPRLPDHAEPGLRRLAHACRRCATRRSPCSACSPSRSARFAPSCSSTPARRLELLDSWAALVGRGRRPSYLKVNPLAGKRAAIDDPSSAMTGLSA